VVRKSNTVIQGAGPETVFLFKPAFPQVHCVNDRAFTTPCDAGNTPRRRIAGPIAVGDKVFGASDDVSDLHPGDWLIITEKDRMPGEVVAIDWAQVASVSGSSVQVQTPFRTAFPNARTWDPDHSGLGFFKLPQLVEGAQFRNFTVVVPDSGQGAPGISVFAAQHTLIENVTVQDRNGQALYSYLSQDLTVSKSSGDSGKTLNEFAATVGTGFFQVTKNSVPSSLDAGIYLLAGVHDGTLTGNSISFVQSSNAAANPGNAIGILARGIQRVTVTNNDLAGGAGAGSMGISVGADYYLDVPISSSGNMIVPNDFGAAWGADYDPTNVL
jgi:hypothetical protein